MVPAGNKAKRFLLVNHTTKTILLHLHHHQQSAAKFNFITKIFKLHNKCYQQFKSHLELLNGNAWFLLRFFGRFSFPSIPRISVESFVNLIPKLIPLTLSKMFCNLQLKSKENFRLRELNVIQNEVNHL